MMLILCTVWSKGGEGRVPFLCYMGCGGKIKSYVNIVKKVQNLYKSFPLLYIFFLYWKGDTNGREGFWPLISPLLFNPALLKSKHRNWEKKAFLN